MSDNLVRRRGAERLAVHQDVDGGLAELVPDIDRPGSWTLFLDGVPQSQVDLDDPGYLEFEYVRRIAHVIDLAFPAGAPLRALHLGGGALTLPRYIAHDRPGSQQLVAEIDAALTALIRDRLPLPAPRRGRIRVRAEDARKTLESVSPGRYDVIVSDVFAGARTPFHLTTVECAQAAARALRPGGVYLVNVADGPPLTVIKRAVSTVRSVFRETCLVAEPGVLRGRRLGNFVLVAGDQPLPLDDLRRRSAADPFPARVADGAELARFAAAAAVITDSAAPGDTGSAAPGDTPAQSTNW
jgi:spermidine synthase